LEGEAGGGGEAETVDSFGDLEVVGLGEGGDGESELGSNE